MRKECFFGSLTLSLAQKSSLSLAKGKENKAYSHSYFGMWATLCWPNRVSGGMALLWATNRRFLHSNLVFHD